MPEDTKKEITESTVEPAEEETRPVRRRFGKRKRHSMHAWHNLLLAAGVYILIACITLLSLVIPDRSFSESENRTLAQAPKLSGAALRSGSFFSDLSAYLQDQLAGRDGWMSARLQQEKLVGRRQAGDVYLGRSGYLLESPAAPDQQKIERSTAMIKAFADAYPDLHMVMGLVPCAAAVFSDLLPKGAPVRDQMADISAVSSLLEGKVSFVDLYGPLHNDTENQVFYRTDHHWTSRGAMDAFRAMEPNLGISGNDSYESLTVSGSFEGTLSSQTGSHSTGDTIEVFLPTDKELKYYTYYADSQERITSLFVSSKLDEKDQYQVFFGGNHPMIEIRTTADTGRNLLLFKDSYANSFVQFLVPHYDRIVMIDPRYYYENVSALINSEGITDVLFLYSMNIFAQDGSLADVLQAAVGSGGAAETTAPAAETGTTETTEPAAEAGTTETTEPAAEAGTTETTEPAAETVNSETESGVES